MKNPVDALGMRSMDAWIYVLSKFTQEALLFEALVLFIGFAAYGAYFVTKKRKYGAAQSEVPSNLVKVYLAQLVADAEDLRVQLFGLLGRGSIDAQFLQTLGSKSTSSHAPSIATQAAPLVNAHAPNDEALSNRLKDVEAKMQEQAKALESVLNEKTRLEQELALAKTVKPASTGDTNSSDGSQADRIQQLEAQLAEYAIIEDDLANLKRLQKENKKLREQLEGAGAAAATSPAAVAAAVTAAVTPSAPAIEAAPAAEMVVETPSAETPSVPTPTPSTDPIEFEALVDQVETSLEKTPEEVIAAATESPPNQTSEATSPDALQTAETNSASKTEKELQDEFEKMLNS